MKQKIKEFFRDKHNIVLILILLFAFITRMYFFFNTLEQPVWWDESQYTEQAKRLGLNLETNDIWYYRRTMLLSVFWSFFYKVGFGEATLRFTEVLFSVLLVYATFLVGREMFNRKVGLFAAFGVAMSRIILFETSRLLNSVPSSAMMMLAFYFFYKGYLKDYNVKHIYLFGLFAGLALNIRFASFLAIPSFGLIFLIKEKGKFWKQKHVIGAFLLILVLLSPFFYMYNKHYPSGIKDFLRHYGEVGVPGEQKQSYLGAKGIIDYIKTIPGNMSFFLFLTLIFGTILLLDFLLAPDLLFKEISLQKNLLLFFFLFPPLIYHGLKSLYVEERYLIGILPILFIMSAYGLYMLYEYSKKNLNMYFVLSVISVVLIISAVYQISSAEKMIDSKKDSYLQVKEASLWMKENLNPGDVIVSNSIPQMQYYTGRSTYYLEEEQEILKLRPKYYVVSIYEKSADVFYRYPEENPDKWKGVKVYYLDQAKTQPSLAIYEYTGN